MTAAHAEAHVDPVEEPEELIDPYFDRLAAEAPQLGPERLDRIRRVFAAPRRWRHVA